MISVLYKFKFPGLHKLPLKPNRSFQAVADLQVIKFEKSGRVAEKSECHTHKKVKKENSEDNRQDNTALTLHKNFRKKLKIISEYPQVNYF